MLERLLSSSKKRYVEPSIAAVTVRLIGLSSGTLIMLAFVVAFLKNPNGVFILSDWLPAIVIWLFVTVVLYVGAVCAVRNAPYRDTSTSLFMVVQGAAVAYFSFIALVSEKDGWECAQFIAGLVELIMMFGMLVFMSIAFITKAKLTKEFWLTFGLSLLTCYRAVKAVIDLIHG